MREILFSKELNEIRVNALDMMLTLTTSSNFHALSDCPTSCQT